MAATMMRCREAFVSGILVVRVIDVGVAGYISWHYGHESHRFDSVLSKDEESSSCYLVVGSESFSSVQTFE